MHLLPCKGDHAHGLDGRPWKRKATRPRRWVTVVGDLVGNGGGVGMREDAAVVPGRWHPHTERICQRWSG